MLGIVNMAGNALRAFGSVHPAIKWGVVILAGLLAVEFVGKEAISLYVAMQTAPQQVEQAKAETKSKIAAACASYADMPPVFNPSPEKTAEWERRERAKNPECFNAKDPASTGESARAFVLGDIIAGLRNSIAGLLITCLAGVLAFILARRKQPVAWVGRATLLLMAAQIAFDVFGGGVPVAWLNVSFSLLLVAFFLNVAAVCWLRVRSALLAAKPAE